METITRKVNCFQMFLGEGYCIDLKFEKAANSRDSKLSFILDASSLSGYRINNKTGAKESAVWPFAIKCELTGRISEEMSNKLKEEDMVLIEGKLRQMGDSGKYKIIIVHIEPCKPINLTFDIPTKE